MTVIGKEFKVSDAIIKRVLLENDVELRKTKRSICKYSCNYNFFKNIDNEEKAYWLGFIYADGFITKGNTFGIKLSAKDRTHLEKFIKSIEGTYPINNYINNSGYAKGNSYCQITIIHKEFCDDLIKLGVVPRKSNVLTFPKFIDANLIYHFIRGYFDGDGSVYISNNLLAGSIVGTQDFLNNVKDILIPESKTTVHKDYRKEKNLMS